MTVERTIDAAVEPITRDQVEDKLILSADFDGDRVDLLIAAARKSLERKLRRSFITQTWRLKLDDWPEGETIFLPNGKILAITSFTYLDADEVSQTLVDGTDYEFSNNGDQGRLIPISSWPAVLTTQKEVITVVYTAGYGTSADDVPESLKEACLGMVGMMYDGHKCGDMVKALSDSYRIDFEWYIND